MHAALRRAHEEALKSTETFRLGAAVLRSRRVVSSGRNRSLNPHGLPSVHAEMDAAFRVRDPSGAHVVVVRLLRDGSPALSRPCEACARALARRGFRKVTFTTGDPAAPLATCSVC